MAKRRSKSDPVGVIVEAARQRHTVEIDYRKVGEAISTTRLVEPYQFEATSYSMMIKCWQLKPPAIDCGWRNFRTDRILRAVDTGNSFRPRYQVTAGEGIVKDFVFGEIPETTLTPSQEYYQHVKAAMLDGKITKSELEDARVLASVLTDDEIRAAHGKIYRDVLDEVLLDGLLELHEAKYLSRVGAFLSKLGWSPGIARDDTIAV